eukprot:1830822-Rhodomonas_salina.1
MLPVIDKAQSDSGSYDNVLEFLYHGCAWPPREHTHTQTNTHSHTLCASMLRDVRYGHGSRAVQYRAMESAVLSYKVCGTVYGVCGTERGSDRSLAECMLMMIPEPWQCLCLSVCQSVCLSVSVSVVAGGVHAHDDP